MTTPTQTPEWNQNDKWRLETRTVGTAPQFVTTIPHFNMIHTSYMNQPDTLEFDMQLYDAKTTQQFLSVGNHEVWAYRNNQLVFAGPAWGATASSQDSRLHVTCEGLESWLQVARVDFDIAYSGVNQHAICWSLINLSASIGSMGRGIVDGINDISNGTAIVRSAKYRRYEGKMIYDVISDFAALDTGFDWEIGSATRAFNTYAYKRTRVSPALLEYGGHVEGYSVEYMGKWIANDILVQGPKNKYYYGSNASSISTYHRQQKTIPYTDAKTANFATGMLNLELKSRNGPKKVPEVTIRDTGFRFYEGDVKLGDTVNLRIADGYVNVSQPYRVTSVRNYVGAGDQETFVVALNDTREII